MRPESALLRQTLFQQATNVRQEQVVRFANFRLALLCPACPNYLFNRPHHLVAAKCHRDF